jgi:hypothetical protein
MNTRKWIDLVIHACVAGLFVSVMLVSISHAAAHAIADLHARSHNLIAAEKAWGAPVAGTVIDIMASGDVSVKFPQINLVLAGQVPSDAIVTVPETRLDSKLMGGSNSLEYGSQVRIWRCAADAPQKYCGLQGGLFLADLGNPAATPWAAYEGSGPVPGALKLLETAILTEIGTWWVDVLAVLVSLVWSGLILLNRRNFRIRPRAIVRA